MALIDTDGLNERYGHREAFIRKLLTLVLDSHKETAARLKTAAEENNIEDIAFLAHSMKGVAGSILANAVADFAKATEAASRTDDSDAVEMAVDLSGMVSDMLDEVRACLDD